MKFLAFIPFCVIPANIAHASPALPLLDVIALGLLMVQTFAAGWYIRGGL